MIFKGKDVLKSIKLTSFSFSVSALPQTLRQTEFFESFSSLLCFWQHDIKHLHHRNLLRDL